MKLTEKLVAIQAQLKAPKDKMNSFGGYKYRSCESILEAVKPLLQAQGCTLTISDEIVESGNRIYVKAKATLSDGESECSTFGFAREPESKKGMDEPQVTGTASSYARKYALNGLFAIDDTKDADTDEYARETGKQAQQQRSAAQKRSAPAATTQRQELTFTCADCGVQIGSETINGHTYSATSIAEQTTKKFKRCLCWSCAQKQGKGKTNAE